MPRLSVVVITRNEEEALPALLASVREIADEVLVVDSGSSDRTVAIAEGAGARVVFHAWPGYGAQRRFAASVARHDLILSLDADERPTPELVSAIRTELARPEAELAAAYRIEFRHRALGRAVRFGAMWKDVRVRLYDRRRGGYDDAPVHERVHVDGPVRDLPGICLHEGYRDLVEARAKTARYAELAARDRFRGGARFHSWQLLRWPAGFLRRYVLWLGFLDGWAGLQLALVYARYDLEKALWLRRLEAEIGGARGRGATAMRWRDRARRLVVSIAALLWPRPTRPLQPASEIRRVLVVRPDERVGNQLLTTPLLRALKRGLPHAHVDLLAAARQSQVVVSRHVDRVIPFQKRLAFRRPWTFVCELLALRRARYDLVIEAGHWSGFSLTASLLARIASAGAPVIGHRRGESGRFLSHAVDHDPVRENEVSAKLELLAPLGLCADDRAPETELGCDAALAERVLRPLGMADAGYAILNPGARMTDRRWPPASFIEVARGIADGGLRVLVVWGPGEEHLARTIAQSSCSQLAPATDLPTLAALLRGARLCVSNNSGPMHLAVAVGTPTVGLFLSDDRRRWGHELPWFEAAEPRGEHDAEAVLAACDRLMERLAQER
jgi:ADP-heptose:LPS heptosyltransferase/glycosyltransferase involved in cell wall biosynthesis